MLFDAHFVKRVLPDVVIEQGEFPSDPSFSVDSRSIRPQDIFVPLRGAHRDGHEFISDALRNGAAGVLVAREQRSVLAALDKHLITHKLILIVEDALHAFIELARAWRQTFTVPVVGITGSVGKTSTKELAAAILRSRGMNVLVSHGNQNTLIGAAINIFRFRAHHQAAIFEMGVSKRGEMSAIADVVRPTTAVITCVGHAHMEGIGSLHDIALEKRDIFKFFNQDNIGIINGDQAILSHVSYPHPVIRFGSKTTNQIQARKIRVSGSQMHFVLKIYKHKYALSLNQSNASVVSNILAACAVAHLLGVPADVIVAALDKIPVIPGRFEPRRLKHVPGVLINDAYNANPVSVKAALLAFQCMDAQAPKIAVLGDMLELGVNSPFWHRQLGRFLRKVPSLKHVILVGSLVQWTKKTLPVGLTYDLVPSWQEAITTLRNRLGQGAVVLVKGSNSMGLINLVNELSEKAS
jgi:UDP-N-acetylmuramoyl-tripeptide--D-alanyl-D-alanine ligase